MNQEIYESSTSVCLALTFSIMHHKIAIGLAAPQVGIQLRLAVINLNKDKPDDTLIIVNPRVLSTSEKKDKKKEACMSLPNYAGEVERRHKIVIVCQDRYGKEETLEAEGFLARAIAHETYHLEGLLYVDRMSDPSQLEQTDISRMISLLRFKDLPCKRGRSPNKTIQRTSYSRR